MESNTIVSLISAVALLVAAFSLGGGDVIENWGQLPSFAPRAQGVYAADTAQAMVGNVFAAPPNFQSLISPRFSALQMPASITYSMPSENNMAFRTASPFASPPPGSLSSTSLPTVEQFAHPTQKSGTLGSGGHGANIAHKGGSSLPKHDVFGEPAMNFSDPSMLPMTSSTMAANAQAAADNGLGVEAQPVVMDRFIAANRNNSLRSQGCMFRGDLPIVPCNSGWFQVSVNPALDLQQGAMNVMGGVYNETANKLATVINMSSGGAISNVGGVNMATQVSTCLKGAGQDVAAVAFP